VCVKNGLQAIPRVHIDMRLVQDAAKRAHGDFVLALNDSSICAFVRHTSGFDMAPSLPCLVKTSCLKSSFDFPKGQWPKPRQPLP
jgi:hypothetical protein